VTQKIQVTRGVRLEVRYGYTAAGRLASISYPDGRTVSYARDGAGHVTNVDIAKPTQPTQTVLSDVSHDAAGHLTGWTAGARKTHRTFNAGGFPLEIGDDKDGLKATLSYWSDNFLYEIAAGSLPLVFIEANNANRVTMATDMVGMPQIYTYDKTGNRLSWSTMFTTERKYEYAPDSHDLLVANKVNREYDANGNTTRIGEREFVYDASGRMTQAKVNGIVEMNYAYDPSGHQVGRYIAGTTTVSLHDEAGHWLGDYDAAGKPIREVVWLGDLPVAALDGEEIRDIQTDQLGTPRVIVDRANNKVIWRWGIAGEAFGSDAPKEDPDGDGTKYVFDMRFPGQRHDAVTGLFQNGWRDYDPTSGRYIQSDPIGLAGGISTYAYVGSNPYVRVDPSGLDFAIVIDNNTVPAASSSFQLGFAGHAAFLVGDEQNGWTYYSKDGDVGGRQKDVRKQYASMNEFFADTGPRYKSGEIIATNRIQDMDVMRWADAHYSEPYSGLTNNCADLVYGGLEAAGIPARRPWSPSIPNGIVPRIDHTGLTTRPINTPNWHPGIYNHKYLQWP